MNQNDKEKLCEMIAELSKQCDRIDEYASRQLSGDARHDTETCCLLNIIRRRVRNSKEGLRRDTKKLKGETKGRKLLNGEPYSERIE